MATEPVPAVHPRPFRVFVARSATEADLAVGYLVEQGIPAQVENPIDNESFLGTEPHLEGGKPGFGVVVPSDRAEEAGRAMEAFLEGGRAAPGDEE